MTQSYNLSQLANNLNTAGQLDATDGLVGAVPPANGGTGQSTFTTGDIMYASGATAIAKLSDVATGNALISGGVGAAPSYGKVGLTSHVNGTLPIANGGTNSTATPTVGGVVYGTGTAYAVTAAAPAGQVLTSTGSSAPQWVAPSIPFGTSGLVSNVASTNYTNGSTTKLVVIFVTPPGGLPTARLTASVGGVAKNWTEVINFNSSWIFSNQLVFMVPPGAVYRVDWSGNTGAIGNWYEAY